MYLTSLFSSALRRSGYEIDAFTFMCSVQRCGSAWYVVTVCGTYCRNGLV